MDFSWTTISLIDIGLFSFWAVILVTQWLAKKQIDQQYNVLQQEFSDPHSVTDWRYEAPQAEHEILKKENATLRAELDVLTREHKALQTAHDRLSGRHDELVERVMPVFEVLAREKLMEINARNENWIYLPCSVFWHSTKIIA